MRGVAVIDTTLYVAGEVANKIRRYDTASGAYLGHIADPTNLMKPHPFIPDMPDSPEFVLWLDNAWLPSGSNP